MLRNTSPVKISGRQGAHRRRLRDFDKVEIAAGESRTVEFEVKAEELALAGNDGKWHLEEGTFTVQCGNLTERLTCTATTHFGENIR